MKKILMVCEALGGGVFTYVTQLCNDLSDYFDIYLAYSTRKQTPDNYLSFLDKKIHLIKVKNFGDFKHFFSVVKYLRKIEKEVNPDIIHLHSSIAGGIGRIAFKGKKNSVIYTPHGYNYLMVGEKTIKGKYYKKLEKFLGKRNCITLTCCKSEDLEAKKFCKNTFFIETGINIKELSKLTAELKDTKKTNDKFKVFTLGRICYQKQPELFNRIAELTPQVDFIWIGDGELRNNLKAKNITVTGWKPRLEALQIAKSADAFILCSLGEAVAMSLIETMFMKKLCLVSNVVGNKDVIRNGVSGFVCDEAKDYSENIKKASVDYPIDLVNNAFDDINNIYNTSKMKEKYISFYNKIINGEYY